MPKEISLARRELEVLHIKWMVELRIEENEGMMEEEAMRVGVKRGVFRDGNGLNETLDFGKHIGKSLNRCISRTPVTVGGVDCETRQTGGCEVEVLQVLPSKDE